MLAFLHKAGIEFERLCDWGRPEAATPRFQKLADQPCANQEQALASACVMITFCILNVAIYILLLHGLLGISLAPEKAEGTFSLFIQKTPTGSTAGGSDISPSTMMPVLISALYFWCGSGTIHAFGREVSIYDFLIRLFQKMFNAPMHVLDTINKRISEGSKELDKLNGVMKAIHERVKYYNWNTKQEEWGRVAAQIDQVNEPAKEFLGVAQAMSHDRLTKRQKNEIRRAAEEQVEKIQSINKELLLDYLRDLIWENRNNKTFIDHIANQYNISDEVISTIEPKERILRNVVRCVGISFVGAFLLTLVYAFHADYDQYFRFAVLFLPMLAFCSIISILFKANTGLIGYLWWMLISWISLAVATFVFYCVTKGLDGAFAQVWDAIGKGANIGIGIGISVNLATSSWDSIIANTHRYVPAPQLLAYASPSIGFFKPIPIGDQTLWALGNSTEGAFTGTSTAQLEIGPVVTTSETTIQGFVTPGGQTRMVFAPTSGGTITVGSDAIH